MFLCAQDFVCERVALILRSGMIVASALLLGRITGFAREWLIATRSGANGEADLAIVLLTFPDLIIGLLLGSALPAALVPRFSVLPPSERIALLLRVSFWASGFFALLAMGLMFGAPSILGMLLPGKNLEFVNRALNPFLLIVMSLPFAALSGIAVAFLNANGRFFIGACGTLLFNVCLILSLLFFTSEQLIAAIVAGVLIGTIVRLLPQLASIGRDWRQPAWVGGKIDRKLLWRFVVCFGFSTMLVLLPPLARAFASYGESGSVAMFNFAYKLVELPNGVLIGAISTVLLPMLAAKRANGGVAISQAHQVAAAIRLTLQCALAITIPVCFFSDSIVRIVFFRAAFTSEQYVQLSLLTSIGFLSLPLQGLLNVFGASFAAVGHTRPLAFTAGVMLISFFCCAGWAQANWHLPGLMIVYVFSYFLGVAVLSQQLALCMGADIWRMAFRRGMASLLLPTLIAACFASIGSQLATAEIWRVSAALLVFLVFCLASLVSDFEGFRRQLKQNKEVL